MHNVGNLASLAADLTEKLGLEAPPIGIAFVAGRPDGVEEFTGELPSSCSFWRQAEQGVIYAPAEKHFNCTVGAMTMGFALPDNVKQELMGVVGTMCECGYIGEDEPAKMPVVAGSPGGIVYGPLQDLPVPPDAIVMWVTPRQAMLVNEADGNARWSSDSRLPVLGRPACSALPTALSSSRPALSMGCIGMRTFTEIANDRMLAVVPAAALERFLESLRSTVAANASMVGVYNEQKARFTRA